MPLHIVILAAGQGKRMKSALAKVLHPLAGKPLLKWVVDTATQLNPEQIHIVYGHQGEHIRKAMADLKVHWVEQTERLGTGHAVKQALPFIPENAQVLILSGDVPLIQLNTLQALVKKTTQDGLGLIVANFQNPYGLGRILRDEHGTIKGIIEERDANDMQRAITEVYSGIMMASAHALKAWLPRLDTRNAQGEYYLTEIIALAVQEQHSITSVTATQQEEVQGINDRAELVALERHYQCALAKQWLKDGVTIVDPNRFDARGELQIGKDVTIDVNFVCEGNVVIGDNCVIGPNVILENVLIANNVEIKANTIIEGASIGSYCVLGPFARVRPGAEFDEHVKIGNFVEVKKSTIGTGSKVSHLSYIGDATIGQSVNVGAGTITCNYDGKQKHMTEIADGAFIGSNTEIVAPIKIGANAIIGAGTTLVKDAPAEQLTLTLKQQESRNNN